MTGFSAKLGASGTSASAWQNVGVPGWYAASDSGVSREDVRPLSVDSALSPGDGTLAVRATELMSEPSPWALIPASGVAMTEMARDHSEG